MKAHSRKFHWQAKVIEDELGKGKVLRVSASREKESSVLLEICLYENQGYIVLSAGLKNTTKEIIQLKNIMPIAGGRAFKGFDFFF